jgi:hypothetical protein
MFGRFCSLTVVSTLVFASVSASTRPVKADGNKAEREQDSEAVTQRISHVTDELKSLKDHEWAGRYYCGDGLGTNLSLCIAPKNGAAFQWHGCLGLYDQNHGSVKETNGRIRVAWALSTDHSLHKPDEYLAIRWGPRRYLVPTEEILEFCSAVRSGKEARNGIHGMFLLRSGDEKLPAKGELKLPAGFEKYLRMGAIEAKIKAIGELSVRTLEGIKNREESTQLVTLNVGKAEGVLPKMEFEVKKPQGVHTRVIVRKVAEHESEAAVTFWRDKGKKGTLPTTLWKLSNPPS